MLEENKRLFFGMEVKAPWPKLPFGRVLDKKSRHMTLAFLGNTSFPKLNKRLKLFPNVPFKVGLVGCFDKYLFLPLQKHNVVSWHASWLYGNDELVSFQNDLAVWLRKEGYQIDKRKFLPHVTLARKPFDEHKWRQAFKKLPIVATNIHLYESMPNLIYKPVWTRSVLRPFDDLEHTADIAFTVRGENLLQLKINAQVALAFKCPKILKYMDFSKENSLDDIIISLNKVISKMDLQEGSPFKAVSFHGEINKTNLDILEWEMVVDV